MEFTIRYFTRRDQRFWEWKDCGEVACWLDGRTIGFRQEFVGILERLAKNGLPPFAAVIVFLELTRDEPHLSPLVTLCEQVQNQRLRDITNELYSLRSTLASFAERNRVSAESKATLAEYFFEPIDRVTTSDQATTIVKQIEHGLGDVLELKPLEVAADCDSGSLVAIFRELVDSLKRIDEQSIELLQRTGVTELPKKPDLELAETELAVRLINELADDKELTGFANLTLNLFAAVTLPKSTHFRDEMPIGGVSDIANRGPLDRLLLSELANDDETLTARIALNEALYLRREPPLENLPVCRSLLISRGIRSWGLPRYFSTAIALAIVATANPETKVQTFSHQDSKLVDVCLTNRESLIEHLSELELDLHPGAVIAEMQSRLGDEEGIAEPIFILEEFEFADAGFQRELKKAKVDGVIVGSVSRDGEFHLFRWNSRGLETIRRTRIDLTDLLQSPGSSTNFVDKDVATNLPVVLSLARFPLRFANSIAAERHWYVEPNRWFTITRDRRVLVWDEERQGARQIFDRLPAGSIRFCGIDASRGLAFVVLKNHKRQFLVTIDLQDDLVDVVELEKIQGLRSFVIAGGLFVGLSSRFAFLIDVETGCSKQRLHLPYSRNNRIGRFIPKGDSHWFALANVSGELQLKQLTRSTSNPPDFIAILESPESPEPVCLTSDKQVYDPSQDKSVDSDLPHEAWTLRQLSADGSRCALVGENKNQLCLCFIDQGKLASRKDYGNPKVAVEIPDSQFSRGVNLRKNFKSVFVNSQHKLVLVSFKGAQLVVKLQAQRILLQVTETKSSMNQVLFEPVSEWNGGFSLHEAKLAGGGRIFLDSRGLIHLKPNSDVGPNGERIPETTIVLHEGMTSGWCSNGTFWGQKYFIGDNAPAPVEQIYQQAIQRFINQQISG